MRGWDEFELEVMRDAVDNVVVVCSIENLDPMGTHTGDSVTVAPQMTLSDEAYQELRDAAAAVIRAVGVECGGSNIQFARDRESGEIRVIEMNPRVSRSSALASKATGYPIAKVAAKLAVGYTLDEIPERPHEDDARELRADARLRGREVPALRLREVPRRRPDARHADEVGGGDDGHRPDLRGGVREGDGEPRARSRRRHAVAAISTTCPRASTRGSGRARVAAAAAGGARLPPRRLRRGRGGGRLELLLLDGRRAGRGVAGEEQAARRRARLGAEPHRPGHRVRLLLRPRGAGVPLARLRGGHGQLQPGDRLHRLRHLRPPVLRAAHGGVRARRLRARAAGRRRHPVRGSDAAEARARARRRRLPILGTPHEAIDLAEDRQRFATVLADHGIRCPEWGIADDAARRSRDRRAHRLSRARAALVRARRARDARLLPPGAGASRRSRRGRAARHSSTASWKAPWRSTSTRSATGGTRTWRR